MKVSDTLFGLLVVAFVIAFGFGWFNNIVQLLTGFDVMTTGEAIARGIGVLVAPFGAMMGYF